MRSARREAQSAQRQQRFQERLNHLLHATFGADKADTSADKDPVPRYEILAHGQAIRCLRCWKLSWHPEDIANRYCSYCKVFHDE